MHRLSVRITVFLITLSTLILISYGTTRTRDTEGCLAMSSLPEMVLNSLPMINERVTYCWKRRRGELVDFY